MQSMITRWYSKMVAKQPEKPLVAIVGATGTGKSKLAVMLAEQFNGEVINGDALQLYQGLPLATNKISVKDRKGIPHHLIDCVSPNEPPWTVKQFIEQALGVIEGIQSRGRLPILVGGTHYYTQALLFQDQTIRSSKESEHLDTEAQEERWPILKSTGHEMLAMLKEVDPVMANRWHPNETRKIRRSLEIWLQTGKKASEIYSAQRESAVGSMQNSGLRVNKTLVFWTHTESQTLNERTSTRLDTMVEEGLLSEIGFLESLYRRQTQLGASIDISRGIWIAIGYKEFKEYLIALHNALDTSELDLLKASALERSKIATRQYAKRQVRWIQCKLLPQFSVVGAEGKFFLLDSTNLSTWTENVTEKAHVITDQFLAGHELPVPTEQSEAAAVLLSAKRGLPDEAKHARTCEHCNVTCTTDDSWQGHLQSKRHRRVIQRIDEADTMQNAMR